MTSITVKEEGNKDIITVAGEMTIEHAAELKEALMRALKNTDHLIIDLKGVTGMDLSCLQLLCSAHRTSADAQKTLEMKPGYPETLKETVREAGYSRDCGCIAEAENGCLWKRI